MRRPLRNAWYVCRHGRSRANEAGIIISDPNVGTKQYGLTETGRRQVQENLQRVPELDESTLIISSDFKRAAETAELIRTQLDAAPVCYDQRLRERFFGEWEGRSHRHYSATWKLDASDPEHGFSGVEPTASVRSRMCGVIEELDEIHTDRTILLVSHGDPLMLLLTAFHGIEAARHRSLPYIETAEIRRLDA